MLEKLSGLYMVDLCTESVWQSFYERFGMNVLIGMVIRNLERQSGTIGNSHR